jgi:hypothetical protein
MKKIIMLLAFTFVSNVFSQVIQNPRPGEIIDPGIPLQPIQSVFTQVDIRNGCDINHNIETLLKTFDVSVVLQEDILLDPGETSVESSRIIINAKEESKNLRIFKKGRRILISTLDIRNPFGFSDKLRFFNDKSIYMIEFPYDLLDIASISSLESSNRTIKFECKKKIPLES